jgi:hypothetical protein
MRRAAAAFTLAALMLVIPAGCGGRDRGAYVKANEAVFHRLPVFPGAQLQDEISSEARSEEDGPVVGYVTRFVYTLPKAATGESVIAFYVSRLKAPWHVVERLGGGEPVVNYRRGDASVSLNAGNWQIHQFEIAVDHAFYSLRGR